MDLSQLAQLRQQTQGLEQKRHQQSEAAYRRGLELLAAAQAGSFRQRGLLTDALGAFFEAISLQRARLEAWVACAYLFMLMGDSIQASRYLREVLQRDPHSADARILFERLQSPAGLKAGDSQAPDYDRLYEQVEANFLRLRQQELNLPRPYPAADAAHRAALQTRLNALGAGIEVQQALFETLEQELDTSALRRNLQLYESRRQALTQALAQSEVFASLAHETGYLQQQAESQLRLLQGAPALAQVRAAEAELEAVLDALDLLADRLDQFESQALPVEALVTRYEALCGLIGRWQDALDEVVPKQDGG